MNSTKDITNILYCSSFSNLNSGGQRSLFLLLERLDRNKYSPFITCPRQGELLDEALRLGVSGFAFVFHPLLSVGVFKDIFVFRSMLKQNKINLIHTDSPRGTVYATLAAIGLKIPLIMHVRVSAPEPYVYEALLFYISKRIVAVSVAAAQRFKRISRRWKNKVEIVYNAVDTNAFSPKLRSSALRDALAGDGNIIVGMVGQIVPLKGQEIFIDSIDKVLRSVHNARFVIIGDGEKDLVDRLRQRVAEKGVASNVRIMSFRKDMPAVMANLDILVNASSMEGLSRVIIEAMASATAIIATAVGGNPESVIDGVSGVLVPHGNPDILAEAIIDLSLDTTKRIEMGRNGRERAVHQFDIQKHVSEIQILYEAVLRQPGNMGGK
jgi:glycosyltransferase involved in cell wall biosynthesis